MPEANLTRRDRRWRTWAVCLAAAACAPAGCAHHWPWTKPEPPDPVLQTGSLSPLSDPSPARLNGELARAHEAFDRSDWAAAEKLFGGIADDKRNSPLVAEEARYHEAECYYRLEDYPKAADTFHKQVTDFPRGTFTEPAAKRMFAVANFWLDDTRAEMEEYRGKGASFWVMPVSFHWEKKKPLLDEEGRALQLLEQVHLADITGPLADKSLFLAGSVKFYRQDYVEADHYFTQLCEMHGDSPLKPQALELGIIAKSLCTGGPEYDGRKLAEARQMIDTTLRAYPEVAAKNPGFLERQMAAINLQQAAKDYETAEFYRRFGKPASAYWCYGIVRLRYPNTKYADMAQQRINDLRANMTEEQRRQADAGVMPVPQTPQQPAAPVPEPGPIPRSLPNGMLGGPQP